MSSPDRASGKRATSARPAVALPPKAAVKSVAKAAAKAISKPPVDAHPSSQEKADFLRAMTKGIKPNTEAARKVEAKKKAPSAKTDSTEKVQVLRKIAAPEAVVNTPESTQALAIAAMIDKALADGDLARLQPHAQQALIGALCRLYAANSEAGNRFPVVGGRTAVTATDVMVMCGALLKAVNLQVFELGMWQSWSSN